jgi:hypothetical protein
MFRNNTSNTVFSKPKQLNIHFWSLGSHDNADFFVYTADWIDPYASVCILEFQKIAIATAIGFAIMGFIGFFVKLIHIPINNIIVQ